MDNFKDKSIFQSANIMKQNLLIDDEFNKNNESYVDLLTIRKGFIDRNA